MSYMPLKISSMLYRNERHHSFFHSLGNLLSYCQSLWFPFCALRVMDHMSPKARIHNMPPIQTAYSLFVQGKSVSYVILEAHSELRLSSLHHWRMMDCAWGSSVFLFPNHTSASIERRWRDRQSGWKIFKNSHLSFSFQDVKR